MEVRDEDLEALRAVAGVSSFDGVRSEMRKSMSDVLDHCRSSTRWRDGRDRVSADAPCSALLTSHSPNKSTSGLPSLANVFSTFITRL